MNQAKKQNLSACFKLKNTTEYFPLSLTLQSPYQVLIMKLNFVSFFFWDKYITTFFVTIDNITELLQTFIYNSKRKIKQEEKISFGEALAHTGIGKLTYR